MSIIVRIGLFVAAAALSSCSLFEPAPTPVPRRVPPQTRPVPSTQPPQAPGVPPAAVPVPPPAPPEVVPVPVPPREHTLGAASRALVAQAQSQAATGDYPVAAGTIERALRIEPDNP